MNRYPKSRSLSLLSSATTVATVATVAAAAPVSLILRGQGVYLFDCSGAECAVRFLNADGTRELLFDWSASSCVCSRDKEVLADPKNKSGLVGKPGASYWISIDYNNRQVYAGVGEARVETAIYCYTFPLAEDRAFLESLTTVLASASVIPHRLLRDPITHAIPLVIKEMHALTMRDVASAAFMPLSNLSLIGQKLHDCIGGVRFQLDDPDFPQFSRAIEASIANPDGWCYKRLLEKATEFGPSNPQETYLRITLNQNNGESPGIPYVMEIWPPGHFSPVHNHAGSHAIIRVLHGAIQVQLFPYLCADLSGVPAFATTSFHKAQETWISPTLNQTHQLTNVGKSTCITIQCYMYDGKDRLHYDFFDYVDAAGMRKQYEPDSDMEFVAFKELMRAEWKGRKKGACGSGCCCVA